MPDKPTKKRATRAGAGSETHGSSQQGSNDHPNDTTSQREGEGDDDDQQLDGVDLQSTFTEHGPEIVDKPSPQRESKATSSAKSSPALSPTQLQRLRELDAERAALLAALDDNGSAHEASSTDFLPISRSGPFDSTRAAASASFNAFPLPPSIFSFEQSRFHAKLPHARNRLSPTMEEEAKEAKKEFERHCRLPSDLPLPGHWTESVPNMEALFRMARTTEIWEEFEGELLSFVHPDRKAMVRDLGIELYSFAAGLQQNHSLRRQAVLSSPS